MYVRTGVASSQMSYTHVSTLVGALLVKAILKLVELRLT